MDRDPIAFLSLLLYRSLPLRRQGKHLVELTLCATMQEWVMKAAGARCWTSIWYVCGDGLIPRPSIFFFFFFFYRPCNTNEILFMFTSMPCH